ncbi:zinc ribbon domain-containing protein [uncultured Methanobrevibacter sp.]|uniref:zinc ribbon domain-containing protein n=1 Tax=uncultured Methanobrevibacter sp. TaxID=253161 RepID=UPI0026264F46
MICPDCGELNSSGAKFCKKCGRKLVSENTSQSFSAAANNPPAKSDDNKNLLIICLTIIIIAVLVAGALIYMSSGNSDSDDYLSEDSMSSDDSVDDSVDTDTVDESSTVVEEKSQMQILSGSFSTGTEMSDKTYCTVYVGDEYAGDSVKISVLYSYAGSNLNQGKIVPKTVTSDGYISVASADAFDYYPDHALIKIYDSNGNVLDTQSVSMAATYGTQTF